VPGAWPASGPVEKVSDMCALLTDR
jgi:hypothetical protein